jgi:hypothetical protein
MDDNMGLFVTVVVMLFVVVSGRPPTAKLNCCGSSREEVPTKNVASASGCVSISTKKVKFHVS